MKLKTRFALAIIAMLGFVDAQAVYAGFEVPAPPSLLSLVTGAAAVAGLGWWVRRK